MEWGGVLGIACLVGYIYWLHTRRKKYDDAKKAVEDSVAESKTKPKSETNYLGILDEWLEELKPSSYYQKMVPKLSSSYFLALYIKQAYGIVANGESDYAKAMSREVVLLMFNKRLWDKYNEKISERYGVNAKNFEDLFYSFGLLATNPKNDMMQIYALLDAVVFISFDNPDLSDEINRYNCYLDEVNDSRLAEAQPGISDRVR